MINVLEGKIRTKRPWVGVLHATPDDRIANILSKNAIMNKCLGLFGLSDYVCNFLKSHTDKKISRIHLGVGKPLFPFMPEAFLACRPKIVLIGHWMRKFDSICELKAPNYDKTILRCDAPEAPNYDKIKTSSDVKIEGSMNRVDYERIFERNIVFLDLMDSSTNNTVVECIVNKTPIVVNRLPALEEHLGSTYPLFYKDIREAAEKISDKNLILAAHEHMKSIDTEPYKLENFAKRLSETEVYKRLPFIKL